MEAFFIDGTRGPLFSVFHPANPSFPAPPGFVYVPPFAEEMNCSRRMAALQARRLAEMGVHVLLLDPFGTGDSGGEFAAAEWETWREDVKSAVGWLEERTNGKVGLWGLRLGALLAADTAANHAERITRLVLWQPVLSGDRYLTQFLRLRLAATLDNAIGRETTKDLRARLSGGETLEVAGYALSPALATGIATRRLETFMQAKGPPVLWLEVTSEKTSDLAAASQELLRKIEPLNREVIAKTVTGEPFWAIQETTIAINLLQATEDYLR